MALDESPDAISGQIPELFMRLYDQIRKLRVNVCQKNVRYRAFSLAHTSATYVFALVDIYIYRMCVNAYSPKRERENRRPRLENTKKLRNILYLRIRIFIRGATFQLNAFSRVPLLVARRGPSRTVKLSKVYTLCGINTKELIRRKMYYFV